MFLCVWVEKSCSLNNYFKSNNETLYYVSFFVQCCKCGHYDFSQMICWIYFNGKTSLLWIFGLKMTKLQVLCHFGFWGPSAYEFAKFDENIWLAFMATFRTTYFWRVFWKLPQPELHYPWDAFQSHFWVKKSLGQQYRTSGKSVLEKCKIVVSYSLKQMTS